MPFILYTYTHSSIDGSGSDPGDGLPSPLTVGALRAAYRERRLYPSEALRRLTARIAAAGRDEVWIHRTPAAQLQAEAEALDARLRDGGDALLDRFPLFGIPFAVKDNIDVAGLPTTAACPAFAYMPARSAMAVDRLLAGQALCLGKTNLDQFATGLVGTRSPYGIVRNAIDPAYIAGGSSSGSAVAVALGLCAFALGTDTAGSGRVPAGLNGIVGLKPSRGLVSTRGVLPACRSLDCVAVFANRLDDAWTVLTALAGTDAGDPASRAIAALPPCTSAPRLGLPAAPEFFGDAIAAGAWSDVVTRLQNTPALALELCDCTPLHAAAALLYQGPWIVERRLALGAFFTEHAAALDPAVREAIAQADRYGAADVFDGHHRLAQAKREAARLFEHIDALLVPTAAIHPRIDAVQAAPATLNARLGHYTNFVNLLDLAALAVPALQRGDGLPFGITLIGPAGSDHRLLVLAAQLAARFGHGSADQAERLRAQPLPWSEPTLAVAVVGAHLSGQPLNTQLIACGARLAVRTQTAPRYRLHALATQPAKPGLVRVAEGGAAIEVEVWEMPQSRFGSLMREVGPPLGIGSLELADGRWVKGFICEPWAVAAAPDISHHGGWRAYLAARHSPVLESSQ